MHSAPLPDERAVEGSLSSSSQGEGTRGSRPLSGKKKEMMITDISYRLAGVTACQQ